MSEKCYGIHHYWNEEKQKWTVHEPLNGPPGQIVWATTDFGTEEEAIDHVITSQQNKHKKWKRKIAMSTLTLTQKLVNFSTSEKGKAIVWLMGAVGVLMTGIAGLLSVMDFFTQS